MGKSKLKCTLLKFQMHFNLESKMAFHCSPGPRPLQKQSNLVF